MDKILRDLKAPYEQMDVSFTNEDKQKVMKKIAVQEEKSKKGFQFVPKTLSFIGYALLFFIIVGISAQQLELIDLSKGGNQTKEHLGGNEGDMIFNPKTIQIGDVIGNMKVTSVERQGDETLTTFVGDLELTGNTQSNDETFLFFPDEKSRKLLPITNKEVDNHGDFSLIIQSLSTNIARDELTKITINQYTHTFGASIERKVVIEGKDYLPQEKDVKSYDTTIELSTELKSVYKEFANTQNYRLLQGLSPVDVFKMHFHARQNEDWETLYSLYFEGEKSGTPTKDEVLNDLEFFGFTNNENDQALMEELKQVTRFEVSFLEDNEPVFSNIAIITWEGLEDTGLGFRLIKNEETEVWKISWNPMQ